MLRPSRGPSAPQGEPQAHMPAGLDVDDYVASRARVFAPLTAVARRTLRGLGFRDGYAPYAPFTGTIVDEAGWRRRTRARLPLLLQPALCWGATRGYNKSEVAVPPQEGGGGWPPLLDQPLRWVLERRVQQRARSFRDFYRGWLGCEPPPLLYHAQGAQFALSRAAIRARPRSFYRALLDELRHPDPVASYYLELMWWYVFNPEEACGHE
jgi:hypothetical protein